MNLLEFENEQFHNLWNEESIKELKENEPKKEIEVIFSDSSRTVEEWEMKQDEYYCWQGSRIPQWFE